MALIKGLDSMLFMSKDKSIDFINLIWSFIILNEMFNIFYRFKYSENKLLYTMICKALIISIK